MTITWYGHSCFKIQTRSQRGGEEIILFTDPFDKSIGLRPPQGSANIITVSHQHSDHNQTQSLKNHPFIIDAPGEYSLKGVTIRGVEAFHDNQKGSEKGRNTIFVIESEEMRLCHLGDLGHILEDKQIDAIGAVDILMIPIGGKYTLDSAMAEKVVSQLEPKLILPMHYQLPNLKMELEKVEKFCDDLGNETEKNVPKLVLKKKDLEEQNGKIIVLDIAN